MEDRLVIVNFNQPLSPRLKDEISAVLHRSPVEEIHLNVGVNMKKNIYIQVVDLVNELNVKSLPIDFVVNLPGLPIAAAYIINELEARAGFKPSVLELHRDKDDQGRFSDFRFGKVRSLQYELECSQRQNRK